MENYAEAQDLLNLPEAEVEYDELMKEFLDLINTPDAKSNAILKDTDDDISPNFFALNFQGQNWKENLKRVLEKREQYTYEEKVFLGEAIYNIHIVAAKKAKVVINEDEHWKNCLTIAQELSSSQADYLEQLALYSIDLETKAPVLYQALLNQDYSKFSLIWDFLESEAAWYDKISLEEIVSTHPWKEAMQIMKGKRYADLFRKVKTNKKNIVFERKKCKEFVKEWKPKTIVNYLNQSIVAQREAKEAAAMLLYIHSLRCAYSDLNVKKSNCLFWGPSGCGKTEIFRQLKEISAVPIIVIDSTQLSAESFSGVSKSQLMEKLHKKYGKNFEKAIVVFDEFDKLARPEFGGEGENISLSIQGDLLKLVEGETFFIGNDLIDTTDVTFVFTGAFLGLSDLVEERPCGFIEDGKSHNRAKVSIEKKLEEFGMIPEMVGRISEFIELKSLTKEECFKILKLNEDKNLSTLFEREDQLSIKFDSKALKVIAEEAVQANLGARQAINLMDRITRKEAFNALSRGKTGVITVSVDNVSATIR